jgi:hypothetical protein
MNKARPLLPFLGIVGLTLSLTGCGGKSPTTPSSPPATLAPAPVTTVVAQGSSSLNAETVAPVVFTTSTTGTLDMTVDWTFPSNDVDIFLARGSTPCTLATFNDRTCGFIATEESTTMKPAKLRAASLAPGTYSLYVANFGDRDESVAWQFVLTTVSGSSASSPTSSAAGRGMAKGLLRRIVGPR